MFLRMIGEYGYKVSQSQTSGYTLTKKAVNFFVAFVEDSATMSLIRYLKIMYRILCKTEGSRP